MCMGSLELRAVTFPYVICQYYLARLEEGADATTLNPAFPGGTLCLESQKNSSGFRKQRSTNDLPHTIFQFEIDPARERRNARNAQSEIAWWAL